MKTIKNLTKQEIVLEGFGSIEIAESLDGIWNIDLFPKNSLNNREGIRLETTFGNGDKYFESPKKKDRISEVYGCTNPNFKSNL